MAIEDRPPAACAFETFLCFDADCSLRANELAANRTVPPPGTLTLPDDLTLPARAPVSEGDPGDDAPGGALGDILDAVQEDFQMVRQTVRHYGNR